MIQKYIITGAPGTGKTTIINALKKKDYYCAEEISRELIAEQISIGGNILPWKNQIAFENLISSKRAKQYASIPKDCAFNSNVFYTPIWEEIYTNDNERKESIQSAITIEKSLLETYIFFGSNQKKAVNRKLFHNLILWTRLTIGLYFY